MRLDPEKTLKELENLIKAVSMKGGTLDLANMSMNYRFILLHYGWSIAKRHDSSQKTLAEIKQPELKDVWSQSGHEKGSFLADNGEVEILFRDALNDAWRRAG